MPSASNEPPVKAVSVGTAQPTNYANRSDRYSSAVPGEEPTSELTEYFWMFWRQRWAMLAVIGIVVASSVLYSAHQKKVYESKASVLVTFVNLQPTRSSDTGLINMEPERGRATSVEVLELAAKKAGRLAAPVKISVSAPENANTLLIKGSSRNPKAAQAMTQAVAASYLAARGDAVLRDVKNAREPLEKKLSDLSAQFDAGNQQLIRATNESERSALALKLTQISGEMSQLQNRLLEFITPDSVNAGTILTNAAVPKSPARPKPLRAGVLALFVGIGLAVALAMLRDRLDRKPRRTEEVAVGARAPILTVVPALASLRRASQREISVGSEPDYTRSFRTLRSTIEFITSEKGVKSIVVTSPNQGDGKTSTVVNLATVLARGGTRVVMVGADLSNPDLPSYFGERPDAGLTTVLARDADAVSLLVPVGQNLLMLAAGYEPIPAELLGSQRMAKVLLDLESIADVVLVDAPGVLNSADAVAMTTIADATLLVVDADRVTVSDLSAARYMLEQVGANVIGAVLNKVDRARFRPSRSSRATLELPAAANWSA